MSGLLPPKILIADDDVEDLEMLKDAIFGQEKRLRVDTVGNGRDLLAYLSRCPDGDLPRLIILDYKMPFFNAWEVLERLKLEDRYAGIARVVWSSSSQREHIDLCLQAGASSYFTKPASLREMEDIAGRMLRIADLSTREVLVQEGAGR